jgi:hypothetical protein
MSAMTPMRRSILAAALIAAGAAGVAGCGDDDDVDLDPPATEGPATTSATSATVPRTMPEGTTNGTVPMDPQSTSDLPGDTAAGTVP